MKTRLIIWFEGPPEMSTWTKDIAEFIQRVYPRVIIDYKNNEIYVDKSIAHFPEKGDSQ